MTRQEFLFILILLLNTLVALVYLIVMLLRKKERKRSCWLKAGVLFLCPVVGPCFLVLGYILFRLFFYKPVDLTDVVFSKERVRTFVHAEEDRERNIVPLEEAVEITETDELRSLVMNVVRGDIQKSLTSIALALNSKDTETAHYAASVLQDALNGFRLTVQKQRRLILEEDENQIGYAEILVDYMNHLLEQRVLTDLEQHNYVGIMDEMCEIIFTKEPGRMTSSRYEAVSLRLLEIEEFELCRKWCERAVYYYPNSLATYTCQLKLYFNSRQRERFFEVIEELKHSAVVIDRQTLELIRAFQH